MILRWTELARTPSYVMRLASVLHTEPMRAIHEDEKPSRQPLHWETVFAGPATRPLRGALMREMILADAPAARRGPGALGARGRRAQAPATRAGGEEG